MAFLPLRSLAQVRGHFETLQSQARQSAARTAVLEDEHERAVASLTHKESRLGHFEEQLEQQGVCCRLPCVRASLPAA